MGFSVAVEMLNIRLRSRGDEAVALKKRPDTAEADITPPPL
jgi:hypothetical protein